MAFIDDLVSLIVEEVDARGRNPLLPPGRMGEPDGGGGGGPIGPMFPPGGGGRPAMPSGPPSTWDRPGSNPYYHPTEWPIPMQRERFGSDLFGVGRSLQGPYHAELWVDVLRYLLGRGGSPSVSPPWSGHPSRTN